MKRFLLVGLLGLVALGLTAPAAPARAAPDNALGLVQATYYDVLDLFFRPLDPDALLTSGWDALNRNLERSGLPPAPSLPDLPPDPDGAFASFAVVYVAYTDALPPRMTAVQVAQDISNGMVTSLQERHSTFLSISAFQNFRALLAGTSQVGSGLQIVRRSGWVVAEVAPGGPGDVAGVKPGDMITAVDSLDVSSASRSQLNQALRGDAGTLHRLSLDRAGQMLVVSLTLGRFLFPIVESHLVGDVGYLRLREFSAGGVFPALDRALDDFDQHNARGLVFDLRGNPGGSTITAAEVLGRFLPDDTTTVTRFDERGHRAVGIVSGQMHRVQLPLIVLVDGGSFQHSGIRSLEFT